MKAFNWIILLVMLSLSNGAIIGNASPGADEILRKIDEHRLISASFEMTIRVESYLNQGLQDVTVMKGSVNEGNMALLTFLEPSKLKGRKISIKGNEMWLTIPNVKNPIRITASQRLAGGVSYADIAGMNFADGYSATRLEGESIAGMGSDGHPAAAKRCAVLELTAKNAGTNYHKIMIWADEQSFLPVKADFFALSGKKMITVYYATPLEWNGKTIMTKMFLFDQINSAKYFSVEYQDIIAA